MFCKLLSYDSTEEFLICGIMWAKSNNRAEDVQETNVYGQPEMIKHKGCKEIYITQAIKILSY